MPIEIALLGCAHPLVADILGVVASEPDLRLAAAWDADRSAVPGAISSHAVSDLDTAIRRADAVVVCAPTDERPGVCARAARAGRPLLVAWPPAATAVESRRLARELGRHRTPAYAALHLRGLPALERLRTVLRADLLGRIASASTTLLDASGLDGRLAGPAAWMTDSRRAGPGGFAELAVHLLDALASLGAPPRLDAIAYDRGSSGQTDFGGTAVGRWAGVPLTVRASRAVRPGELTLTIDGARASARVLGGTLEIAAADGAVERWVGAPPDAGEALRAFASRLRSRRLDFRGLEPALDVQQAIERAVVTV
jgi:predicted dehydrogenase